MSRCFPYPPPGYEKSKALIESVTNSIKLQKEREKAKKERKKEKKREKEKSREDTGKTKDEKHSHKKRKHEEMSRLNQQGGYHAKTTDDEIEQLEKSGLTEEHGLPVVLNPCYSSDSTENSAKRRKHGEPDVNDNHNHGKGSGLLIRLPLQKHKDLKPPPSTEEQPCFSGRAGATVVQEPETDGSKSRFHESSSCSGRGWEATLYRDLFVKWNPPPLQMELPPNSDELDWLFSSSTKSRSRDRDAVVDSCQADNSEAVSRGRALCSWPPRACYLSDADIHALPFVVPF